MLKGIDPLLSPELLQTLSEMGHGDEILVADANFPAAALAHRLCHCEGADATELLGAILTVLPLDQYVECPAAVMAVVGQPNVISDTEGDFQSIVDKAEGHAVGLLRLERFQFYERARNAFAVVATGERRLYGNILLTKGVVNPHE